MLGEGGFGIEGVNVRRGPVHEEKYDAFGPGREVGDRGGQEVGVIQGSSKSQGAEAAAEAGNCLASGK